MDQMVRGCYLVNKLIDVNNLMTVLLKDEDDNKTYIQTDIQTDIHTYIQTDRRTVRIKSRCTTEMACMLKLYIYI